MRAIYSLILTGLLVLSGCSACPGNYILGPEHADAVSAADESKNADVRIKEKRKMLETLDKELNALHNRLIDVKNKEGVMYEVCPSDSLWKIAGRREVYGNSFMWVKIYSANRDILADPQRIYPGQLLIIPGKKKAGEPKE